MKVIGFDGWTQGAHHYERLIESFKKNDIELILIHQGSFGNEVGRKKEEYIGDLLVRDISYYGEKSFLEILTYENPSAVIFLSTDSFVHRAFNRYCIELNIPTINLTHGMLTVLDVDSTALHKVNIISFIKLLINKLPQQVFFAWPIYLKSLWLTNASFSEWVRFFQDVFIGAFGTPSYASKNHAAKDAKTNVCCVYTTSDIEYMKNRYGFQSNEMFEVGNPDLIRFNFDQSFIASHLLQSSVHYDSVMYIDNGLICSGLVFESENEFISHIISTSEQLKRFNKKLIFKPHPGHLDPFIFSNLENYGVKICDKDDFVSSLQKCSVAIVEPSTLAILPALTGMPILLASYGKLCNQHFGRLLTSYPKSIQINYLSDISESVLSPSINIDESSTKAWIEDNVGMLPASDMPNRVVNVVMDLIN